MHWLSLVLARASEVALRSASALIADTADSRNTEVDFDGFYLQ